MCFSAKFNKIVAPTKLVTCIDLRLVIESLIDKLYPIWSRNKVFLILKHISRSNFNNFDKYFSMFISDFNTFS